MYRILFFLAALIIPTVLGWWIFVPMALLYVYLAKLPYELVVAGFILDLAYYFGDNFLLRYPLTLFSAFLLLAAFLLGKRIHWRKII